MVGSFRLVGVFLGTANEGGNDPNIAAHEMAHALFGLWHIYYSQVPELRVGSRSWGSPELAFFTMHYAVLTPRNPTDRLSDLEMQIAQDVFRTGMSAGSPRSALRARGLIHWGGNPSALLVFRAFSEALESDGALILDVREWGASLERKTREPLFRKRVSTDRGELTFTSVTALDPENRQLLISERHELIEEGVERTSDYHFVMRCWEKDELDALLARHGFGKVSCFGAYDPGVAVGATDRLVVVAQR